MRQRRGWRGGVVEMSRCIAAETHLQVLPSVGHYDFLAERTALGRERMEKLCEVERTRALRIRRLSGRPRSGSIPRFGWRRNAKAPLRDTSRLSSGFVRGHALMGVDGFRAVVWRPTLPGRAACSLYVTITITY